MTIKYTRTYLEELAKLETPERGEYSNDDHDELCHTYADIRNLSKELQDDPWDKDVESKLEKALAKKISLEEKVSK